MGVIKRQTIWGAIYSYIGVAIGFIVSALIMPKLLSTEEIGLVSVLVAYSALYAQFSTLGFTNVTSRMFSYFRDRDKNHNGFVFLSVVIGIVGFTIASISFFILKPYFIESNQENSPILVQYIYFLIPLIFFRTFFLLLDTYNKMLFDATTGTFLSDVVYRVGNLFLLGAFYFGWINFAQYICGYVLVLCFPTVYLAILLIFRKQFNLKPKLDFINPPLRKEMISMSIYGIIGGLSSVALTSVDKILLKDFFNLSVAGIYTIVFYFGTIIQIPNRALGKISSTIIADSWKDNKIKVIDDIYYKSSINQLYAGLLLFILLVSNLRNIFEILPPEYSGGDWVIILISLANLIVVSTGVSVQILVTSDKYKIQTYSLGLLLILTVGLNFLFIPILGMNGAALATLFASSLASLVRVVYLKRKMNLFPYKLMHLKCVGIGALAFLISWLIPTIDNFIIDLFLRSSVISGVFILLCYLFKISPEVNSFIETSIRFIIPVRHK